MTTKWRAGTATVAAPPVLTPSSLSASITPHRPPNCHGPNSSNAAPPAQILVPQTDLHAPQRLAIPRSHNADSACVVPYTAVPNTVVPNTVVPRAVSVTSSQIKYAPHGEEEDEHEAAWALWCSDYSVPDSQPPAPASPWHPVCYADTPCPPERHRHHRPSPRTEQPCPSERCLLGPCPSGPCPSEPPSSSPPMSQPLQASPDSKEDEQTPVAFARLSHGPLLAFATPAPTAASLELPAAFSPVADLSPQGFSATFSPTAAATTAAQTHPPFDPICPLPTLVDPPYAVSAPCPPTSSNPAQAPQALLDLVWQRLPGKFAQRRRLQTRELRLWERGHWRIDVAAWRDPARKATFWCQLKDAVLAGRLGAVTLSLETEDAAATLGRWPDGWRRAVASGRADVVATMERRGNGVRLYCWGGAVEPMWCVLYIFGYRGVDGAVWVDGAGDTVITML